MLLSGLCMCECVFAELMASGEMFDGGYLENYDTARQQNYAQRCNVAFCIECDGYWSCPTLRNRGIHRKRNLISRERNVKIFCLIFKELFLKTAQPWLGLANFSSNGMN